jgi:hypothetical protein
MLCTRNAGAECVRAVGVDRRPDPSPSPLPPLRSAPHPNHLLSPPPPTPLCRSPTSGRCPVCRPRAGPRPRPWEARSRQLCPRLRFPPPPPQLPAWTAPPPCPPHRQLWATAGQCRRWPCPRPSPRWRAHQGQAPQRRRRCRRRRRRCPPQVPAHPRRRPRLPAPRRHCRDPCTRAHPRRGRPRSRLCLWGSVSVRVWVCVRRGSCNCVHAGCAACALGCFLGDCMYSCGVRRFSLTSGVTVCSVCIGAPVCVYKRTFVCVSWLFGVRARARVCVRSEYETSLGDVLSTRAQLCVHHDRAVYMHAFKRAHASEVMCCSPGADLPSPRRHEQLPRGQANAGSLLAPGPSQKA